MSDDLPIPTAPRKLGWRTAAILGAIAFIAGLGVMALGLYAFPQWFGSKPVATVTLPLAATADGKRTPVVIVPGAGPAAAPAIDLDALSTRETELAARLADLEARTASVGGQARAASGYATRAEGLMIAFAARRQLDRGLPLGYIEEQLRERFGPIQPPGDRCDHPGRAAASDDRGSARWARRDRPRVEDRRCARRLDGEPAA